jgi:hypothetical protein
MLGFLRVFQLNFYIKKELQVFVNPFDITDLSTYTYIFRKQL